jgi:hypothetical protein
MTLPPPDIRQLVKHLHAMIGSSSVNEANTAREKLVKLLAKHHCTWNDVPEILAATNGSGAAGLPAKCHPWSDAFHTADGAAYVDIHIDGHRETWPVRGRAFGHHVRRQLFAQTRVAPTQAAVRRLLDQAEAEALDDGQHREVYLRVAQHEGRIYLDLADDQWRAVEIGPDGWRTVKDAPVRFRRAPGMLPLPVPQRGGSVDELAKFLNVQRRADFILIVSWLLAALRGAGPFPVLGVWGEEGSAKSMLVRMLRALVDPNVAILRSLPHSERDLFVSANASFVQAFDNKTGAITSMSDPLCRLATGGAFATRQLNTDRGEVLLLAKRPIILNGISCVIRNADLADRSISATLESIPDKRRRAEKEIMAEFEAAQPGILGALLDAVSCGLRELPNLRPTELARMADFDLWGRACEPALWPAGSFQQAYTENRSEAVQNSIEADLVATTIKKVVEARGEWQGTATDLLGILAQHTEEGLRRADKNWPKTPEAVRHRLDRARTNLRKVGIEITHDRAKDRGRDRLITISTSAVPGAADDRPNRPDRPEQPARAHGGTDGSDSSDRLDASFEGSKKTNGVTAEFRVLAQPKGRPRGRPKKNSQTESVRPETVVDPSHLGRIKFNKKAPN